MTDNTMNKKSQLAKLLATENITVQENAVATASFDVVNRILTIPIFKEEQKSKHVYDMLVGHEVSHALHTPAESWKDMKNRSDEFRSFVNVLEDVRIDKLIQKKYPGLTDDYLKGFAKMYKDNFFNTKDKDIQNDYALIDKINLYYKSSKTLDIKFSKKEKILVDAADNCKTFDDVLKLAEDILGYCKEELKKQPKLQKIYTPKDNGEKSEDSESTESTESKSTDEKVDEWLAKQSKDDDKKSNKTANVGNPYGAGGDTPITSQTNAAFDEAVKKELVDNKANKRHYVTLPKVNLKNMIIPYKKFIRDNMLNDSKEQHQLYIDGNQKIENQTKQFIKDSSNVVNYLVKEFEMKKSARLYARASQDKTGIIDPLKLHTYKFAEDIFKKITIVPNEKNHGMIFLLDWSGSMQKHLLPTVEQLINLVLFVRKINIPFSVYKFVNNHENDDPKNLPFEQSNQTVEGDQTTKLVHLYSHKQSKSDFFAVSKYLHRMAKYWNGHYGRYYDSDDSYMTSPCKEYYLCSTPLNESLIAMDSIIPKFRQDYKSDKVALVTLTDGGANSMRGNYSGDLWVKLGKNHVQCNSWGRIGMTQKLLKYLKKKHNIKTVGFYLVSKFRDLRFTMYLPYDKQALAQKMFTKDKCIADTKNGYDVYFYVKADTNVKNTTFDNTTDSTDKRTLKKMFMSGMKGRIVSRILLQKFIKEVA